MLNRSFSVHGVRPRRSQPKHLCRLGRSLALLLISGAIIACAESSVSDPEFPESPSHDVLDAVAATDTGGHIDEEHTGQDSVGRWHSFDPPDGVVRDGIFEARYTTNEVSQDEEMRFHYTVDEAGSPCEGDKVVVTLRTGTRLLDKSSELAPLTKIPDTPELFFGPLTSGHFDTYFLLPETIDKLNRTAAAFARSGMPAHVGSGSYDSLRVNAGGFRKCEIHNGNHVHCFGNARAYTQ